MVVSVLLLRWVDRTLHVWWRQDRNDEPQEMHVPKLPALKISSRGRTFDVNDAFKLLFYQAVALIRDEALRRQDD